MTGQKSYNRRQFSAGAAAAIGVFASPAARSLGKVNSGSEQVFEVSVGASLVTYGVDAASGTLRPLGSSVTVPAEVQACWQHPATKILYVASSDQNTTKRGVHALQAFRVMPDGSLAAEGEIVPLRARPIFVTVDHAGQFVLTAYNKPSMIIVHRVAGGGGVGGEVVQDAGLDTGVYAHQVRVMPSNRSVLMMARGNDATVTASEDPGSLRVFGFADGRLTLRQVVQPGAGMGFRPRHADFHPTGRWAFIDLESQNRIQAYAIHDDILSDQPVFQTTTLRPADTKPSQLASAVVMAGNGRTLYVANRGTGTEPFANQRVSNGGANTIAVFSIDQGSGKPHLIQTIEAQGIHVRTMSLSIDGNWLAAASIAPANIRSGDAIEIVPAGLSLFRVHDDSRLTFASKTPIVAPGQAVFWSGAIRT